MRQQLIAMLSALEPRLLAAYLFGSEARGESRPNSDIDIAVLADRCLTPDERWRLQETLAAQLGRDVDLVDLRSASTVMQMQIVKNGSVLIDTDARYAFEGRVYTDYTRLNEERRPILERIKATGSVYGR